MGELLNKRKLKLPKECRSHYAEGKVANKEDELCRFLATSGKYPWGSCIHHVHTLGRRSDKIFTTFTLKDPSINFLSDSSIVLPSSAKIVCYSLKLDKNIIQQIDSWFAGEIILRYKRLLPTEYSKITPLPFYYNDNLPKAMPLSLMGTPPIQFEFEIEGVSSTDEIKLINEYVSSDMESYTADETTLQSLYQQYVPHFISIIDITVTSPITEVILNSNNKVIKSLYFRIYSPDSVDIRNVKRVNLAGEDIAPELYNEYYKSKFSRTVKLPYYVISFCPNPKSEMPEYGEVFKDDKLVIELEDNDKEYKIDVTLETVNENIWMTREQ